MNNEGTTHTTPTGLNTGDSIVEPRAAVETTETEEMFLTPRVLDASAFSKYADTLKGIIAQASAQGRTLEDFSADAEAMIKRCDETSESVNKRLQAGIRMLKMIDERAERTDQLLERVQEALPDAQAVSERIDRVIDERLAASESRIQELITDAERRAQESEQRAQAAIEQSKTHAADLESLGRTVEQQLNSLRQAIETNEDSHANYTQALQARIDEAKAQIERTIGDAVHNASEAGNALESRIEVVSETIEPLAEASDKAMRALGMDPAAPVFEDSPLSRIESLVDRGEVQLASLDRVYRQLEDLQTQAESVRSAFGSWLTQAADEMDVLENRKTSIVGPVRAAAELVRELGPDIEQKLELASTELSQLQIAQTTLRQTIAASSQLANETTDRLSNQSGQLQAIVDGSVHKLSTRVEQAGVWLGSLIQRAETLGASLPGAGSLGIDSTNPFVPSDHVPQQQTPFDRSTEPTTKHASYVEREVEELRGFTIPEPPQLPIDALSFDGSAEVFEHDQDDQES